jgi:hypothetical protein
MSISLKNNLKNWVPLSIPGPTYGQFAGRNMSISLENNPKKLKFVKKNEVQYLRMKKFWISAGLGRMRIMPVSCQKVQQD